MEDDKILFRDLAISRKSYPTKILNFKIVNATQLISTDVLSKIVASITQVWTTQIYFLFKIK